MSVDDSGGGKPGGSVHRMRSSASGRLLSLVPAWVSRCLAAPLLATIVVILAWYVAPLAQWLSLSTTTTTWAVLGTWVVVLVAGCLLLRSVSPQSALGRLSRGTTAGVPRWLRWCLVLALVGLALVMNGDTLHWVLLALLAVSIAVLLMARSGEPERDLVAYQRRLRRAVDPVLAPDIRFTEEFVPFELDWDLNPHGVDCQGSTVVWVDSVRRNTLQLLNPRSPRRLAGAAAMDAAVEEYVILGTSPEIDRLAVTLADVAAEHGLTVELRIQLVLSVVQRITYGLDIDTTRGMQGGPFEEYWRYPVETIFDQVGDCEDTAVLAASVLRRMGMDVGLVFAPGHVGIGVAGVAGGTGAFVDVGALRYLYCETTAEGWHVGDLPDGIALEDLTLVPVAASRELARPGSRGR